MPAEQSDGTTPQTPRATHDALIAMLARRVLAKVCPDKPPAEKTPAKRPCMSSRKPPHLRSHVVGC